MTLRLTLFAILAAAAVFLIAPATSSAQGCPPPSCWVDPEDPPPPPPPCDLDRSGGIQGPCQEASFPYEGFHPDWGATTCWANLEGATPPNDFLQPRVQYRAIVSCNKMVRRMAVQAHLYRGSPEALGQHLGSGPYRECFVAHPSPPSCMEALTSRGPDVVGEVGGTYTLRAYVRFDAPEADPWVTSPGTSATSDPRSCAPGGQTVECLVDLKITATP